MFIIIIIINKHTHTHSCTQTHRCWTKICNARTNIKRRRKKKAGIEKKHKTKETEQVKEKRNQVAGKEEVTNNGTHLYYW